MEYHYVTARDAGRAALLVGPFRTHPEAVEWVDRARQKSSDRDVRAWFYTYGTARLTKNGPAPHGILNAAVGLGICDYEGCYVVGLQGGDFCSEHKNPYVS